MKIILFPLLLSTLTCTLGFHASGQIAGNAVYANGGSNRNTGMVDLGLQQPSAYSFSNILESNVLINVKATAYTAIFSITQHGNSLEQVETGMAARVAIFKNQLQQVGITEGQIFIDPISLVPEYEIEITEKKFSKTLTEVPKGFEIKKNVHISFKQHDQINTIIATAAKAEVYDLAKVEYAVENMDVILANLREQALNILIQKKQVMEKTGLHLRFLQVGERYGSAYPFERYTQYVAFKTGVAPSFTVAQKKGVPQQQVQYNYAEKNKTYYYEKVSDKQFDMILNPVVGEPEVQIYLSLKAQFEKYNPETEAADKAYQLRLRELELQEKELVLESRRRELSPGGKKK